MELDCPAADHQALCNSGLFRPSTIRRSTSRSRSVRSAPTCRTLRAHLDQRLGRLGRQGRAPNMGRADGIAQFFGRDIFKQIPDCPCLQRALYQFLILETGQSDALDVRKLSA